MNNERSKINGTKEVKQLGDEIALEMNYADGCNNFSK